MSQAFFLVTAPGPGITEINVYPFDTIIRSENHINAFNIPGHDLDIVNGSVLVSIGRFNIAFGQTQHRVNQVNGQLVDLWMAAAQRRYKGSFTAAQFNMKGLLFFK